MKRKNNRKRKVNKKLWTMLTASVLAAALGTIGILHHLEPMEAYAKETFSGTKQVVDTHTGNKPFVILDVVPDYAAYAWNGNVDDTFEIQTGTLGYLVKGQSTMGKDYASIYEKKKAELSTYEQRAALVSEIWKSGSGDSNLVFQYEEAYGSTRMELNRADENGWKLLIPSASLPEEDKMLGKTAHSGLMRGYFKAYDASTAGSTQGYDYIKVGNWNESASGVSREIYEFDAQKGTYQVRFVVADSGVTAGYFVDENSVTEVTDGNKAQYSLGTSLYTRKSNGSGYIYTYAGTIAEKFPDGNALTAGYSIQTSSPKLSPSPTETSSPEKTSVPTQTPTSEQTPVPTQTPTMEKTPVPTQTPTPEKTPVPTQTPTSEKTPASTKTPEATVPPNSEQGSDSAVVPTQTPESEEDDEMTVTTVTVTNKETYAVYEQTQDYGEVTQDDVDGSVNTPAAESYYVVTFKYESTIQTGETRPVYKADTITAIPEGSSNRPYDVYTKNGDSEEKTFLYVGAGQGQYKLTDQADISEEEKRIQEPVWMVVRNAPTYFRYTGGCDWLKQYVFHALTDGDNQNADFAIQIQTVRADDLTEEMIRNAELIYLESGAAPFINTANSKVTLKYLDKSNESKFITQNDGTRLPIGVTQANVYAVVYRAVNELLPVIVDAQTVWNASYADSNYQKMARIFLKEDLETYLKDANAMASTTDALLNQLDSSEYPDCTNNGFHYVNHNIYVVNGTTPLVNGDFAQSFDEGSAQSGFREVLSLIQSENYLMSEEDKIREQVSKAKAIEYIINYSIGLSIDFTDLNILELQPTQNDTANLFGENDENENGGTTLYCQKSDERESGARKRQVIRSSKKINVDVEVKSVSAFNSEWEDINQNYNLVFIGLDGQRLNHSDDRYHTVVYNDRDLNGKLYHSGDRTGNSEERYDPSDITERKKNELLDFMRAGYPVLVENEMFIGKSAKNGADRINTKYVANDTWMYEFLSQAVSDEELKNRIYTINDLHSSILFMEQLSVDHPVVKITNIEEAAVAEGSDGTLTVGLSYGITNRKGDSYDGECSVEFYLDINDDGNYTASEQMNGGGDGIQATAENGQVTVSFKETPGSRAIPYCLKVADSNNSYRRSSVEGILQIMDAQKETIRILQIGDKDETSLSNLYQKTDSTLGYYLKAAENEMNVKFDIETVDSKVLTQRFEKNPNCLNQWDLLILGFGNGSESLSPNMIERYIQEGHGVLVTGKGAAGERLLLSGTLLGQLDRKTYGSLGFTSGTSYFRYAELDAGMFGEQNNMKVAALNHGSVFSYPLSVGRSAQLQGDVSFKAYDYLLDLGRTEAPFVTPWLTFAGSGNDNDTNAYSVSPNDGANNYYLYSKGNVVFIGNNNYSSYTYQADNQQIPQGAGVQDCQMFVNAMMLAYDAGVHNMKVDIVSGFDTNAAKVSSISIPFDQEIEAQNGLLDETVDVYFKFKNSNLTLSNAYAVNFYYEDAAGETALDVGDEKVQVTLFTSSLWTVQDNTLTEVAASQIRQGKVYRFKAPVVALQNNTAATNAKIYVEVVSTLERPDGVGSQKVRGYDSVTFTRTQLFLLE